MPLSAPSLLHARTVRSDSISTLQEVFSTARAKDVLDVGCGTGGMAAQLSAAGFVVTGIDPQPAALQRARTLAPTARFVHGTAEDLPDDLGQFDAACFVNALHHVGMGRMQEALLQVLAQLKPGGVLVVIEPLAFGSFFRCMQLVDDETEVRAAAITAVEAVVHSGQAKLRDLLRWDRESHFTGLSGFIDYLLAVDPDRRAAIEAHGTDLAQVWCDTVGLPDGEGILVQPIICWILVAAD